MPKSIKWSLRSLNPPPVSFSLFKEEGKKKEGVMVIPTNIDPPPGFFLIDNVANETVVVSGQSVRAKRGLSILCCTLETTTVGLVVGVKDTVEEEEEDERKGERWGFVLGERGCYSN